MHGIQLKLSLVDRFFHGASLIATVFALTACGAGGGAAGGKGSVPPAAAAVVTPKLTNNAAVPSGAICTGTNMQVFVTAGEMWQAPPQSGTGMMVRPGVQGFLFTP